MPEISLIQFLNLFDNEDIKISLVDAETNEELVHAWYSDIYDSLVGYSDNFKFLKEKEYFVKGFDFINDMMIIDII